MARFIVTISTAGNDVPPHVIAKTRRENGALNVLFAEIESARAHLEKRCDPGGRVVSGPTNRPNEYHVVLLDSQSVPEKTIILRVERAEPQAPLRPRRRAEEIGTAF